MVKNMYHIYTHTHTYIYIHIYTHTHIYIYIYIYIYIGDIYMYVPGLGREEIKVCDAFWKQEMSPWSNAPPGLRNPFSKTYFSSLFG